MVTNLATDRSQPQCTSRGSDKIQGAGANQTAVPSLADRQSQLAVLDSWYSSYGPPVLYMWGPLGSGKTTLISQWTAAAQGTVKVTLIDDTRPEGDLERILPRMAAETRVLMTARRPPPAEWLLDPALRSLMQVVALPDWEWPTVRAVLRQYGIVGATALRLYRLSYGRPWILQELAQARSRGRGTEHVATRIGICGRQPGP